MSQELDNFSEDEHSNDIELDEDEMAALEGLQAFAQGEARSQGSPKKRKREEERSSSSTNASSFASDDGEDDDEDDLVDLMINESSDDDGHRSENEATPSHRQSELPTTIVQKKKDPPTIDATNELASDMLRVWGHGNRCTNVHASILFLFYYLLLAIGSLINEK